VRESGDRGVGLDDGERVVCALGLTIATFWPTRAFTSVDLPALGAPITATKPARDFVSVIPA